MDQETCESFRLLVCPRGHITWRAYGLMSCYRSWKHHFCGLALETVTDPVLIATAHLLGFGRVKAATDGEMPYDEVHTIYDNVVIALEKILGTPIDFPTKETLEDLT